MNLVLLCSSLISTGKKKTTTLKTNKKTHTNKNPTKQTIKKTQKTLWFLLYSQKLNVVSRIRILLSAVLGITDIEISPLKEFRKIRKY